MTPFLNSPCNTDSKNVQDFDDWTKIDGVMGKKLKVGQFQNLHAMTTFHRATTTHKSEKKSNFEFMSAGEVREQSQCTIRVG